MRRARTWRWVRVFLIHLQGWCCPPMSDLGIIWAHEQSYAPARCWVACIASIRSRPLWTDRVFADHSLVLVLDNAKYHHARALQPWLGQHRKLLTLLFLP